MTAHELFDDMVPAYALSALSPGDRSAFEAHLGNCSECREALAAYQQVWAAVGAAGPGDEPPASLKARTLARATAQPQLRPQPQHAAETTPVIARSPTVTSAAPDAVAHTSGRWRSWALAASLLLAAGLGTYALATRNELSATKTALERATNLSASLSAQLGDARRDAAILASTLSILRAGDMIRVDLRGPDATPAPAGRAFVSRERGLLFDVSRLPALRADRTYQLWVVPPGSPPISAGTFTVDTSGASTMALALPAGLTTIAVVAVSEEPAGGSLQPTTQPLLVGRIAGS